jgi:hypothetical protein
MVGSVVLNAVRPVGHLPRDEDAALAADLHSYKALIKARNRSADSLYERQGLRVAQLGFAIGAHDRLAVFIP